MNGDIDEIEKSKQMVLLADHIKKVQEQSFFMKRAIDLCDLNTVIEKAADLVKELKVSTLSPRAYYELYMKIVDELHFFEEFCFVLNDQGTPMVQLYQHVQACNQVLPRLYLMITVGGCFIKSKEAPSSEILSDLVEMCKGVQHPMRGLFLRSYLSHVTKDKLPDSNSPYADNGGNVQDCIDFLIENFVEANRLWVRVHSQAGMKDKKQKERERKELRLLVGMNLVRLSELEGVDSTTYKGNILPRVLDQIVSCKDTIAQSYLMDCLIQAFPDVYHVDSLPLFLDAVCKLKEKVRVRSILECLMQRIGKYDERTETDAENSPATFHCFNNCVSSLINNRPSLSLKEIILLEGSLLEFSSRCYPSQTEFINICLKGAIKAIDARINEETIEAVQKLLLAPLDTNGLKTLFFEQFKILLELLPLKSQVIVARSLLHSVISCSMQLSSPDTADRLLSMLTSIIIDNKSENGQDVSDQTESTEMDQNMLARLLYCIPVNDTDSAYQILIVVRRHFGRGGEHKIRFTLVPLVLFVLKLVRKVRLIELEAAKESCEKIEVISEIHSDKDSRDIDTVQVVEAKSDEDLTGVKKVVVIPSPIKSDISKDMDSMELNQLLSPGKDVLCNESNIETVMTNEDTDIQMDLLPADIQELKISQEVQINDNDIDEEKRLSKVSKSTPISFGSRKFFQFTHETVTALANFFPTGSLKLFLQCAVAADECDFSPIAYEFISQACIIYEEDITEAGDQLSAIRAMVGAMLLCKKFNPEDWEAISTKIAQYSGKMLRKQDQCRAVFICSHLFWCADQSFDFKRDEQRVLECLQRSLKIADSYIEGSLQITLFVEILNQFLYYFEHGNVAISPKYISGLVALIKEHTNSMNSTASKKEVDSFFTNTLAYIVSKQNSCDISSEVKDKFLAVKI